jgi:predicted NACHT family NTPase
MGIDVGLDAFSPVIEDIYNEGKKRSKIFFEGNATKTFKTKVHKHTQQLEKVKTMWQKEKIVSVSDFYFPSKIEFSSGRRKTSNIDDLNADRESLVIQGTQGQGKSIFLRYLAIQQLKQKVDPRIPIFVELKNCRSNKGVRELALEELKSMGFTPSHDTQDYYFECGKFVLLLDAFDEVEEEIIGDIFNEITNHIRQFEDTQIIITTRPDSEITKTGGITALKICPLDKVEIHPFLSKLGVSEEIARELAKNIQNSKTGIDHVINTPLLLTLAAILYQSYHELPDTLSEFYKQLFNVLFARHDRSKPGLKRPKATKLNETQLRRLFDAFSFVSQNNNKARVTEIQFLEFCNKSASAIQLPCDSSAFLKDIVSITCLMVRDGLEYAYVHKSVQEFHSAAFIANSSLEFAKKFYASIFGPKIYTWRLTLDFLAEIDRLRWIEHYAQPLRTAFLREIGFHRDTGTFDGTALTNYFKRFVIGVYPDNRGVALWRFPQNWSTIDEGIMNEVIVRADVLSGTPLTMSDITTNNISFSQIHADTGPINEVTFNDLLQIPRFEAKTTEALKVFVTRTNAELASFEKEMAIEKDKLDLLG